MEPKTAAREILIPAPSFTAFRQSLRREAGALVASQALNAAGYAAGSTLFRTFQDEAAGSPEDLPVDRFWDQVGRFFQRRGWGRIRHDRPHPGLGRVRSPDWAEAEEEGGESQPTCAYSAGMLAGLLSQAADGTVAALEVSCRSRGDEDCSFVFGSEGAVQELYGRILDGMSLEDALGTF